MPSKPTGSAGLGRTPSTPTQYVREPPVIGSVAPRPDIKPDDAPSQGWHLPSFPTFWRGDRRQHDPSFSTPRDIAGDEEADTAADPLLSSSSSRSSFSSYTSSVRRSIPTAAMAQSEKQGGILQKLDNFLRVDAEEGLTAAQLMLTNHDLQPVEPARRRWSSRNFVAFWIADSFNINTWMIASSAITASGLSWWQSWICTWIGYSIAACFVCLTGRIGATYHISFPVVSRASFGTLGSLWPVFNRAAMACVWYGVQGWIGGQCVWLMITAIWSSYRDVPNGIPSSGTDTQYFLSFFLFWAVSLIAIWFPVHQIRHLFTAKAYVVPAAGIAFFIWAIVRAGGIGPIVHQPATATGSKLGWGIVSGIMSNIANFATLIVNSPDFTRFAKKPRDALWSQLLTIPIGFAITSFIGLIVSSSSNVIYGQPVWNPLDLLKLFLQDASSAQRFGVFVIAFAFALAQLGTNIAANSVSAGTDMTALFPRYLNIRRGGYICALVGLCMCPWNLLSSSNSFTDYLSSYSVFLSSIAGVMLCDYYIIRKGYLDLRSLYSVHSSSPYMYWHGWSWRAYAAYISGILINIVGFAGAVGRTVPLGAQYIYRVNYFAGILVAAGVYWILCRIFPVPGVVSDKWMEVGDEADRNFSVVYTDSHDPGAAAAYDEEREIEQLSSSSFSRRRGSKDKDKMVTDGGPRADKEPPLRDF